MINLRRHYFPSNECVVITGLLPTGEYGAYREQDDGRVRGYGYNRFNAIADLVEALAKTESEEDQMFSEAAE